jgi:hypothetical protein
MITLDQFWDACDRIARDRGTKPVCALEPAGIYLVRPLERFDYHCTPTNSVTFAHTGMDGEHFGFLAIGNSPVGAQPVVMTVPMAFRDDRIDSFVIAEDLEEFLRLGCRVGWWMLPDLLMRGPDDVLAHYQNTAMDSPEGNAVLQALRGLLGLTPVPLDRERLAALDARYGPMIELPPIRRA